MASALTIVSLAKFSVGVADVGFEAADQSNGNSAANDGFTFLIIANADASSKTCTVTAVANNKNYNTAITKALTVAAGDTGIMGPFPESIFSTSLAISWDADTSTTIAAISVQDAARTPTC